MRQDIMDMMLKIGELRPKSPDNVKIKSLLESIEINVKVTKGIRTSP